jgi:hypothetical protein
MLNLNPPYQRRSVWNQAYKDDFIDTVLLQYPAPAIFLYEEVSADGVSVYHVVDGKQRLTSVFEFAAGVFPVSETSTLDNLRGISFANLSREEKTSFWTYQFPVEYLPTNNEAIINTIFQKINKNTARLTRQELRHARFGGPFIKAAEELSDLMPKKLPEGFPRIETQARKQMKDVEMVAGLLLAIECGIKSYSQDEFDEAFSERETAWDLEEATRSRFLQVLDRLKKIADQPIESPLYKTRLRNQTDFYSFFAAVNSVLKENGDWDDSEAPSRLSAFVASVDDEAQRTSNKAANDYFKAARSNSNDFAPRKIRRDIIVRVLNNTLHDYAGSDSEQVQVA